MKTLTSSIQVRRLDLFTSLDVLLRPPFGVFQLVFGFKERATIGSVGSTDCSACTAKRRVVDELRFAVAPRLGSRILDANS